MKVMSGVQGTGRLIPAGDLGIPAWIDLPLGDIHHFLQKLPSLKSLLLPPVPRCSWDCKSKIPVNRSPQFFEQMTERLQVGLTSLSALWKGKKIFESHVSRPGVP
jgi:hypothetical protein